MADGNQSGEAQWQQQHQQMNGQNGVPNQQPQLQPGVQPQPFVPRPALDPMTQMMGMMQQMFQQMQQQLEQQSAAFQQQQVATQQQLREHQDMIRELAANRGPIPHHPEQILDSLASNIKDFRYDPESSVTFTVWFSRYEDLFEKDAARLDGDAKVRLLLRKLGEVEHERYTSYILPKKPKDFSLKETVQTLKGLFGAKESVVSKRYRCLQITKQPTEDHVTYACRVNKLCVEFELDKLKEDQFKCLVYVCGLKSESDAEIRTRLLSKIEEQGDVTLQQMSDECQRLLNLKHDKRHDRRATAAGEQDPTAKGQPGT